MSKVGLVVLIVGVLVSLLLPALTEGRTSWDEAMFGIIPGALLLSASFVVALAGVVVLVLKRKRARPLTGV